MKNNRKLLGIALALLVLIVPLILLFLDPGIEKKQSLCLFKMLFGFPCPGCGMTKSIIFLYAGEMTKSLAYHIFGPFVVAISLLYLSGAVFGLKSIKILTNKIFYSRKLAYILLVILGSYHLIRIVNYVYTRTAADIYHASIWDEVATLF